MSEESHKETLSQRHRQLLRRGDGRVRGGLPSGADAGGDAQSEIDAGVTSGDGLIDGRYRLLRCLGSGRLGDIYEARIEAGPESALERVVALQLLRRWIAADLAFIDKLRRGYAALRAGPHRNIVRLEELGRHANTWYLVMERLEGASLRFVLDDVGALPVDEAMPLVRSIGDALSYLHAKEMVHGAVTPSSVFVTEDYEVRLLDIVPAQPPSGLPDEGGMQDSRAAPAPEVADDVYGLACVGYQILTGGHPYNYATAAEAHRLGLTPQPVDGLPPLRWRALARGLAADRDQRPSSVSVLLKDLGVSAADRPTVMPTAAPVGRPPKDESEPLIAGPRDRLATAERPPEPRRGRWLWSAFGAAVIGLLAAIVWVYQVPIRDAAVERLATAGFDLVARSDSSGADAPADGLDENVAGGPSNAGSSDIARVDVPATQTADDNPAVPAAPRTEPEAETGLDPVADDAPDPGIAAEPPAAVDADSAGAATSSVVDAGVPPESETRYVLAADVVHVAEDDSSVAITIRRVGGLTSSAEIVWWTSDETARAGDDYADLGERVEVFAAGVESLTLHVPLVDDGLPEPLERFIVGIGRSDPGSNSIQLIASVRVDVEDDDNTPR